MECSRCERKYHQVCTDNATVSCKRKESSEISVKEDKSTDIISEDIAVSIFNAGRYPPEDTSGNHIVLENRGYLLSEEKKHAENNGIEIAGCDKKATESGPEHILVKNSIQKVALFEKSIHPQATDVETDHVIVDDDTPDWICNKCPVTSISLKV